MHDRWPELTFDCTVKVEHILRHADLWPELAAAGCLFVVSAFETVTTTLCARLDKGHTAAQAAEAVALLRRHGIEVRPSFLPFTPWTTLDDVADLIDFVAAIDLVPNVDPVQYTIRLLLPEGSLLDRSWPPKPPRPLRRRAPDVDVVVSRPRRRRAPAPSRRTRRGRPDRRRAVGHIYGRVRAAVHAAAGRHRPARSTARSHAAGPPSEGRPRLTEPWFC